MFYGEVPKGVIQTGKDGFRHQAAYESIADALGANKSQESGKQLAPSEDGSGFWLFALIVFILTTIISLFTGSEYQNATADQEFPEEGDGNSNRV